VLKPICKDLQVKVTDFLKAGVKEVQVQLMEQPVTFHFFKSHPLVTKLLAGFLPVINFSPESLADFDTNDVIQVAYWFDLIETDGLIYTEKGGNFDLSSDSCIVNPALASKIVGEVQKHIVDGVKPEQYPIFSKCCLASKVLKTFRETIIKHNSDQYGYIFDHYFIHVMQVCTWLRVTKPGNTKQVLPYLFRENFTDPPEG